MGTILRRGSRLGLESLERRLMLDGNVAARIENGNLFIWGDDLDNAIQITRADDVAWFAPVVGEVYWVSGLNTESDKTLINGEERFLAAGVTGNVSIALRDGNDTLVIEPASMRANPTDSPIATALNVPGNLTIRTDGGDDQLRIENVQVGKDLLPATTTDPTRPLPARINGNATISTGDGKDTVALGGVVVKGNLALNTGAAADQVELREVTVGRETIRPLPLSPDRMRPMALPLAGNLSISTGNDDDTIVLGGVAVRGNLSINADGGADSLDLQGVKIGQPEVDAMLSNLSLARPLPLWTMGNAFIATGSGVDSVAISDTSIVHRLVLATGADDDRPPIPVTTDPTSDETPPERVAEIATIEGLNAKYVDILTGAGPDQLALTAVTADRLWAHLGSGNDQLSVLQCKVRERTVLNGGPGEEDVLTGSSEGLAGLQVLGFEKIDMTPMPTTTATPLQDLIDRIMQRLGNRGLRGMSGLLAKSTRDRA